MVGDSPTDRGYSCDTKRRPGVRVFILYLVNIVEMLAGTKVENPGAPHRDYEHVTAYENHPLAPDVRDALYRLQSS
jgi:hypothetical protein